MVRRVAVESPRAETALRPTAGLIDSFVRESRATPMSDAFAALMPELRQQANEQQAKAEKIRELEILDAVDRADIKDYNQFMSDRGNMDAMTTFKVRKAFGAKLGFEYGLFLNKAFQDNPDLANSTDPTAIIPFIKQSQQQFLNERNLDPAMVEAGGFMGGFKDEADKFSYNITQQHIAKANEASNKITEDALASELFMNSQDLTGTMIPLDTIAANFTDIIDRYSKTRIGGRKAKEAAINFLFNAARNAKDENILKLADSILVGPSTDQNRKSLKDDPLFAEAYKVREAIIDDKWQTSWRADQAEYQRKRKDSDDWESFVWQNRDNPNAIDTAMSDPQQYGGISQLDKAKIRSAVFNASEAYEVDNMIGSAADREALVRKLRGMSPEALTNYKVQLYKSGYSQAAVRAVTGMWNDVNDEAQTQKLSGLEMNANNYLSELIQYANQLAPVKAKARLDLGNELFRLKHGIKTVSQYRAIVGDANAGKKLSELTPEMQLQVVNAAAEKAAANLGVTPENKVGNVATPPKAGEERTTTGGTKYKVINNGN